jgi:peptidoglycan-associated lipoprotein
MPPISAWPERRPGHAAGFHRQCRRPDLLRHRFFGHPRRCAATLDRQAQWLNQYPTYQITIEGHADERGTREYNLALGARRAAAARQYLSSRGVAANRINTISFGKERPVAVCDDISCWSQNRRAVTVLGGAGS